MKKNFTPFSAGTEDWQLKAFPAGKTVLEISNSKSRSLLRINRGEFAGFSEVSALPEIFRLHRAEDGLSLSLETRSIIPFGSEFQVERDVVITNGCASMTTSVAACNRGEVGNITLETIEFPGPWAKISYRIWGEEKMHCCKYRENAEFYAGSELPWYIQVEYRGGVKAEFITGSDIWRHRAAAKMEGVTSAFRIADNDGTLVLERAVLIYDKETVVEKRPWQFESLFAWSVPCNGEVSEAAPLPIPGCLASRKTQRSLRQSIRKAESSLQLTEYTPQLCTESRHLDRSGKKELEHIDLQDLFQLYCWGNRQLSRKGMSLTVAPSSNELLPHSLLLEHLSRAPEPIAPDEEE